MERERATRSDGRTAPRGGRAEKIGMWFTTRLYDARYDLTERSCSQERQSGWPTLPQQCGSGRGPCSRSSLARTPFCKGDDASYRSGK